MTASDIALLADGALIFRVDPGIRAAVEPWIPRHRAETTNASPAPSAVGTRDRSGTAVLHATLMTADEAQAMNDERGGGAPTLILGGVRARVAGDEVLLSGRSGIHGRVQLANRRADVSLRADVSAVEMHGSLTLASALLIGRLGRALVHAAAIVDPAGRGWLLVGDSHSGKTTTCATLMSVGWKYVADDQVVLSETPEGLFVEGWPRDAHLDSGWSSGRVTRNRVATDLTAMRRDIWAARMMMHGICFPVVAADRPTALVPIASAEAFVGLVRQSPWLLADAGAAVATLELLRRAASTMCAELTLGRDSYANGAVLVRELESMRASSRFV